MPPNGEALTTTGAARRGRGRPWTGAVIEHSARDLIASPTVSAIIAVVMTQGDYYWPCFLSDLLRTPSWGPCGLALMHRIRLKGINNTATPPSRAAWVPSVCARVQQCQPTGGDRR